MKKKKKTQEEERAVKQQRPVLEMFGKEPCMSNGDIFYFYFSLFFQLSSVLVSLLWPRQREKLSILKCYF